MYLEKLTLLSLVFKVFLRIVKFLLSSTLWRTKEISLKTPQNALWNYASSNQNYIVLIIAQWIQNPTSSMKMRVPSLASLSGLTIRH